VTGSRHGHGTNSLEPALD